jgi:glyoxylase-like metal-dependent hydrolase (beta-lactamase superfamily II)
LRKSTTGFILLFCGFIGFKLLAETSQQLPELSLSKVSEKVYSAIGVTLPPDYSNWGHNNNLSVIIGDKQVMVVNGGDSYLLAKALHREIKKLTSKPVAWLVNENGQGHSMLGNSYWREMKVPIIANIEAAKAYEEDSPGLLARMKLRSRERAKGTFITAPDITFDKNYQLDLGNTPVELINFGPAHSAGDVSVWLPQEKTLIAGDIAFHQRMLAVFPETNTKMWLLSFEKMMQLKPQQIVPGHGQPTDLVTIKKYTYDYLVFLRTEVERLLDEDLGLTEAYQIDQSVYSHLDTFDELAGKNAGRVFQEMEMDAF